MGATVLACGRADGVLTSVVLSDRPDVTVHRVPAQPGRTDVDHLLDQVGEDTDRLVVVGEDADLAAVVLRVLRTNRLAHTSVGFAPLSVNSAAAEVWGLPRNGDRALEFALTAEPRRVPLVRDGNGGVLIGRGRIGPLRGVAYCDETMVLRGPARSIQVAPHVTGIQVTVTHARMLRSLADTVRCRAFELGCLPTVVVSDGVPHDRPVHRWHWYRHTEDLRLVVP
jgi:hypothetical protein